MMRQLERSIEGGPVGGNVKELDRPLADVEPEADSTICPRCGKKLKTRFGVEVHLRKIHGVGIEKQPIPCDICGKLCLGATGLQMHKTRSHNLRGAYSRPAKKAQETSTAMADSEEMHHL